MVIRSPSLTSLGLRSLRHINDGAVYITGNKKLCYLDTINWTRIISSGSRRRQKNDVKDNRPIGECGERVCGVLGSAGGGVSLCVVVMLIVGVFPSGRRSRV